MPPQAAQTQEKRTRQRTPTIRVSQEVERKLDKLAEVTAGKVKAAGGIALKPSHSQLVEAMVDAALESDNGTGS